VDMYERARWRHTLADFQAGQIGETAAFERSKIVPSSGFENNKAIASIDPASWPHRRVRATIALGRTTVWK
jgi:hypothetical protein